ncbi:hypothetical protein ACE7GA_27140 (plasmid) [Roseomonas sp. CCTCC AB2023176]|uniref:hypothetical protein n=1 Tax=Roseomonas sp. CCTCC AB2023176 TaxID=3342640 RepID=UPI0035DFBE2B
MAYINPLTARLMLRCADLPSGALVGVNAAASAAGRALLRMSRAGGLRPVAVVRSEAGRRRLVGEPAEAVLVQGERLPPLDGGFDAVGGDAGAEMALAVRPGGVFVHYGLLSGQPLPPGLGRAVAPGVAVRLFSLRQWVHSVPRAELRQALARAFEDVRGGLAAAAVEARYGLTDVRAALAHHARAGRSGKILFAPTDG